MKIILDPRKNSVVSDIALYWGALYGGSSVLQFFKFEVITYNKIVLKVILCVLVKPMFTLLGLVVVFPQDLLENGLAANNFAMLGLGDIVIPGIFIALLLRFDMR